MEERIFGGRAEGGVGGARYTDGDQFGDDEGVQAHPLPVLIRGVLVWDSMFGGSSETVLNSPLFSS